MLIQYYKQQFQVIEEFTFNNTLWYRGQLRFKNGNLGKKIHLFCSEWNGRFFTIISE